jgi:hypothetical protein
MTRSGRDDLWLDAEALLVEVWQDRAQRWDRKKLKAAFHVTDHKAGDHVARECKDPVQEAMHSSLEALRRICPTIADHEVCLAQSHGFKQPREFGRVVFEVGVLNDDGVVVTCEFECAREACSDGGAFAAILRMKRDKCFALVTERMDTRAGRIIRSIIGEYNLRLPTIGEWRTSRTRDRFA